MTITICLLTATSGIAADWFASINAAADFDSNVYQDDTREWDFAFRPKWMLGGDFETIWTAGYTGDLSVFLSHDDLFFHRHEAYLSVNPAWGESSENEFLAELSCMTQRNADAFSVVNLVQPTLTLLLASEPRHWVRWSLSEQAAYRYFYDDTEMDSVDSFTRAAVQFTAKTRTTFSPRVAFGFRGYPHLTQQRGRDASDMQIEAGIHLSQNLVEGVGLQADYAYRYAFEESVFIARSMGLPFFSYIGDDFLYTGHTGMAGLKSIFETGVSFGLEVGVAYKTFGGWTVLDDTGAPTGGDRTDLQLEPRGWIAYTYTPSDDASRAVPEISITLSYAYLRQWSNDNWYDTDRHTARLGLTADW